MEYYFNLDVFNKILDSTNELDFHIFSDDIKQVDGKIRIDISWFDHLFDLYNQWQEQEELGKDVELIIELRSEFYHVWYKDGKVEFYISKLDDNDILIAKYVAWKDEFQFIMDNTRGYFNGNLKKKLEIWKYQLND